MEDKIERIGYIMNLYAHVFFNVHHLDNEVFTVTIDEFKGTGEKNGKTVIYYPWDNEGAECPYEYVKESEDEVMELYKQAYNLREELYKKYEVVEKQKTKIRLIMNITEDYVSIENAKLLKEKGFDSEEVGCRGGFYSETAYESGHGIMTESGKEVGLVYDDLLNSELGHNEYLRPTLQMAMKWMREVHKLHITVYSCSQESWAYRITKPHQKLEDGAYAEDFASYEETCDAAIKCCLEKLI